MENGIVVFWLEGDEKRWESFNFAELIDMKINASDLIMHPASYKIDQDLHKLMFKK
jgi:hypothetical protein